MHREWGQREREKERSYRQGDAVYSEGGSKRGKSYREKKECTKNGGGGG